MRPFFAMNGKSTAYRIVAAQLAAVLLVAALLYAASGTAPAAAAAAGGGIAVISNFYFARRVFAAGVLPARTVLRRFYIAEAVKIFLTAGLFLVALAVLELSFLPMLLGYGITLVVHWAALLLPAAPVHR